MSENKIINLALVGCGTVGGGVINILTKNHALIKKRLGLELTLKYVVDVNGLMSWMRNYFPA